MYSGSRSDKFLLDNKSIVTKAVEQPSQKLGAVEQPSGHLPSDLHRPVGSRVDGTFTAASDLCMMALIAACLEKRPWLLIQLSPYITPNMSS